MDNSSRLSLPYIMPSQAQKHVTHNEAVRALDVLVQLSVKDIKNSETEVSPVEGDCYLIGTNEAGLWSGKQNQVAAFQDGAWMYYPPNQGWQCWVEVRQVQYTFTNGGWIENSSPSHSATLGVNTAADSKNRLAVKSDSILFSHDDGAEGSGDARLYLNKEDMGKTASLILQSDFSAKAELGIMGNDNMAIKSSSNGDDWKTAMTINNTSGHVCFGDNPNFSKALTVCGKSPFLRISNTTETPAGIEIVDAQASRQQSFQLTYDCRKNTAQINVNQVEALKIASNKISAKLDVQCDKLLSAEHFSSSFSVFIAGNNFYQDNPEDLDPGQATNLDHFWNEEASNTWHFCADTTYKATGNATLRAAAFTTTSDYRLKENITDINDDIASSQLMKLRPVEYNWTKQSAHEHGKTVAGFIAHELQEFVPSAVNGQKDQTAEDGVSPIFQSVDYNQLLPLVVASLQNAIKRISDLEHNK